MSKTKASADPTKRHKSRYHGITYRVKRDGSRTYSVYHRGRYWPVEGGENEALVKQGELRGKAARGEKAATPSKATFRAVAEEYIESKLRLRPGTRKTYRSTLDRILIPRFGDMKIGALTVRDVGREFIARVVILKHLDLVQAEADRRNTIKHRVGATEQ